MAEEPADPFGLASTPSAYVPRAASERALHELDRALRDRRVPALLGPPGLGKTLLLQRIAARVGHRVRPIYVPYSPLSISELCALALGLAERPPSPDPVAALLNHSRELRLQRSGLLLLIDDAGALPVETAEALVGLVEASRGALSVALAAIDSEESARVCAAFGDLLETIPLTEVMSEEETLDYVERRLAIADAPPELRAAFDEDTVMDLHAASEGVPRRLNVAAQAIVRSFLPDGPRMPGLPEPKDETPFGVEDGTLESSSAEVVSSRDDPSMEPLEHAPYPMGESVGPEPGIDSEPEPDFGFCLDPERDEESEIAEGPCFDAELEDEAESGFERVREFEQEEAFDPEFEHEPEYDPEEEFDPGPEFEDDLDGEPDLGIEPGSALDGEPAVEGDREPIHAGASPFQEAVAMLRDLRRPGRAGVAKRCAYHPGRRRISRRGPSPRQLRGRGVHSRLRCAGDRHGAGGVAGDPRRRVRRTGDGEPHARDEDGPALAGGGRADLGAGRSAASHLGIATAFRQPQRCRSEARSRPAQRRSRRGHPVRPAPGRGESPTGRGRFDLARSGGARSDLRLGDRS
jgi:type II secretory pathway predicted ATPase ExeA